MSKTRTSTAEPSHDLLTEPVIGVRLTTDGVRLATLPQVLELLGRDQLQSFPALQLHQAHAWHAFLVQLAAIALNAAGDSDPVHDSSKWAQRLRGLTGGRDEPWCLVVPDLARPALLQPPVPEGTLKSFKEAVPYPDAIDILVTAKNHDVKATRIGRPRPEHWVYALVTLQTMQGYLGRYYGIARMNKGHANRPCVALAPGFALGRRFRRDVAVLLDARQALCDGDYGYLAQGGKALLWLEPWDGNSALGLDACDPYFIEVCRRVRLVEDGGRIAAWRVRTEMARLGAEEHKGDTGDPWTPVARDKASALTVGGSGFHYKLLSELLLGANWREGVAQRLRPTDGDGTLLVAQAVVRGEGATEGLHERFLALPPKVRAVLGQPADRDRVGRLAGLRVEAAGKARNDVLRPALWALLQGGPDRLDFHDDRPRRWLDHLDDCIDVVFFEALFADLDLPQAKADRRWAQKLVALARVELDAAMASAPLPSARRYRAFAAAERVFEGCARKRLPEAFGEPQAQKGGTTS